MKTFHALFVLGIAAAGLRAQPVTAGFEVGVPSSDAYNRVSGTAKLDAPTHHYTLGPKIEFRLPRHLSLEIEALYRSFEFRSTSSATNLIQSVSTRSGQWEFPVLLRYRLGGSLVRPFAEGGVSVSRLTDVKNVLTCLGSLCGPGKLAADAARHKGNFGFVAGGGLDIKALVLHVTPEIRYTHWTLTNFNQSGGQLQSNTNQTLFLVGLGF